MSSVPPPPVERFVTASGLSHHVLEWGAGDDTVVLCHGFLDFGWSWRWVAELLAAAGFRVVAFDWRGHGESEWIGAGGYYHFADYARDLSELLPQLASGGVHLVGHSMGGTACALYAAAGDASGLKTLSLIEGWGIEGGTAEEAPAKLGRWIKATQPFPHDPTARSEQRLHKPMRSSRDAIRRLLAVHPRLQEDVAAFLAEKGTVKRDNDWAWRFDPLHRTPSPSVFSEANFEACLRAIEIPVLTVVGTRGLRISNETQRLSHLRQRTHVELEGEGHMMHWTAPKRLAAELSAWLDTH